MPRFRMRPLRSNDVHQLFEWRDEIDLDPPYQRLSVWDKEKRQTFIDSVLNGFDIPKLYFHDVEDSSRSEYRYAVIDGKQRMQALWEFMSNQLPLADDFVFFDDPKLDARSMINSEWTPILEGVSQGGVISPLLSNVLLTPFDLAMGRRGFRLRDTWTFGWSRVALEPKPSGCSLTWRRSSRRQV